MCSEFLERIMDDHKYDQGDLADIFRAVNGTTSGDLPDWQFESDPILGCPTNTLIQNETVNSFGHPFNGLGDPLLNEPPSSFLMMSSSSSNLGQNIIGGENTDHHEEEKIKIKPGHNINLFSRMLQISPTSVKLPLSSSSHGNEMMRESNTSSRSCLVENHSLQISSPRNTGIKRRKSQAKKVVCIPAPAPANSRPTGEIVPSDLWAWRKYGQKPIKGSPYPRGYYRCSSSKGCPARKQVERSRTDPNMLVITYTSEHNHAWPTQRNALAGSTRTPPIKSKNNPPEAEEQQQLNPKAQASTMEEERYTNNAAKGSSTSKLVKLEEISMDHHKEIMEMEDGEYNTSELGFSQSYRPALPSAEANHPEDFFADLGEIEVDPLNLLFTEGFSGDDQERSASAKDLDPFSFYDWTPSHNNPSPGGEAKS